MWPALGDYLRRVSFLVRTYLAVIPVEACSHAPSASTSRSSGAQSFVRGLAWSKALREREGAAAESVRPNPKAAREIPCDSTGCWDYVDGSIYTDHRGGKRY